MADQMLTELDAAATPLDPTDLLYLVQDVGSTPLSHAAQVSDLINAVLAAGGTFTVDISVPDEAYGAGWNGSTETPTKNAIYDALATYGQGYIEHGATASTARPVGFASVTWVGTVVPDNLAAGDFYVDVS